MNDRKNIVGRYRIVHRQYSGIILLPFIYAHG